MITVTIEINGKTIYARTANNISKIYGKGMQEYHVDTGEIVKHDFDDGCIVLAKKLLDTIKEK